MPELSLPVEHLFTITADTMPPIMLQGAPQGNRGFVAVTGGTFEGPKLTGTVVNGGGDWLTLRPDGSAKLDVRLMLLTDDGTHILMTYTGIGKVIDGIFTLRTTPLFEAPDGPYAWLNTVQGVATGAPGAGTVKYDVYALR